MKYCSSCKALIKDEAENCTVCSKALSEISGSDPVTVVKVKGRDTAPIEAALKNEGIPCSFEPIENSVYNTYNRNVSAETENKLLVPFDFYSRTFNICLGLGLVSEEDRLVEDNSELEAEDNKRTYDEKFESKTGVKHTTWKIVWIIIFIVAACLLIWGIDFIADYIKGIMISNASTADEAVKAVVRMFGM